MKAQMVIDAFDAQQLRHLKIERRTANYWIEFEILTPYDAGQGMGWRHHSLSDESGPVEFSTAKAALEVINSLGLRPLYELRFEMRDGTTYLAY